MTVGETDPPVPKEGQVLIRVIATSVNGPDLVQRRGKYPPPKGDSEILGVEVSGIVEALGPGVTDWHPGDRVVSLVGGGGYAEYAVAWAEHLIALPGRLDFEEGACIPEAYIVAWYNIFRLGDFRDGRSILIHGGGGGVNTAAIQIVKTLTPRSRILVTASPSKIDKVKELGADFVIDYKNESFADAVMHHTEKKGVDLILDHIGADYLAPNMRSLAVGGKLVVIGVNSGIKAEANLGIMMVKRQSIMGSVMRPRPVKEKGLITRGFTESVMPHFDDGSITPLIHRVFPLEEVQEAHRTMEESRHFGKIVLGLGR